MAITEMIADKVGDSIEIKFPQVKEKRVFPDGDMRFSQYGEALGERAGRDDEMMTMIKGLARRISDARAAGPGAYISKTNEPGVMNAQPEDATIDSYNFFHPAEVSLAAFREHLGYRLAPEDIGAMILLDFGEYVNQNLKRCASIFNGKIGKKKEIKFWLEPGESLKQMDTLLRGMHTWERDVQKEMDSKLANAIHPKFSSYNPVTDMVYAGLLMGAAREFFEYKFATMCGISKIKVEGKREDWQQVRDLVTALSDVPELAEIKGIYDYINGTVLEGILGAFEGREELDFWRSLVKYSSFSGSEGKCAGWLPSISLYGSKGQLLPMDKRWQPGKRIGGFAKYAGHLKVPVVSFVLVSDPDSPVRNADPSLNMRVGFTNAADKDGYVKPVLGFDAYAIR